MNAFIIPPPAGSIGNNLGNPVYQKGSNLTVQWSTNYISYSLRLNQDLPDGSGSGYILVNGLTAANTSYLWKVGSNEFNFTQPSVYWLRIESNNNNDQDIDGSTFNVSVKAPASTSSVTTPTATLSTTSTPSSTSNNSTTSANSPPPGGLATGAAIGVGLGIAGFLALLAILFVFLKRRRSKIRNSVGISTQEVKASRGDAAPFELPNLIAASLMGEIPIMPLAMHPPQPRVLEPRSPPPAKQVRFSENLPRRRYELSTPSISSGFGEDVENLLSEVITPSATRFSEDLERRLSQISGQSFPDSQYGSIHNMYDVSPP